MKTIELNIISKLEIKFGCILERKAFKVNVKNQANQIWSFQNIGEDW